MGEAGQAHCGVTCRRRRLERRDDSSTRRLAPVPSAARRERQERPRLSLQCSCHCGTSLLAPRTSAVRVLGSARAALNSSDRRSEPAFWLHRSGAARRGPWRRRCGSQRTGSGLQRRIICVADSVAPPMSVGHAKAGMRATAPFRARRRSASTEMHRDASAAASGHGAPQPRSRRRRAVAQPRRLQCWARWWCGAAPRCTCPDSAAGSRDAPAFYS